MRVFTLNVAVDDLTSQEALGLVRGYLGDGRQHYVVTPNPEMIMLAKRDREFRSALLGSDLALADGFGLTLGFRLLGYRLRARIPGADFLGDLFGGLPRGTKFFFFGGGPGVAEAAAQAAARRYGATVCGVAAPPHGTYDASATLRVVNHAAHEAAAAKVRRSGAQVLVVALGHGQQEKWMAAFLATLPNVRVAIGVGGALDYLAGRSRRAPQWLRRVGLEWLWRLWREPSRWPRIFVATIGFCLETTRWLMAMRLRYRPLVVGCITNSRGDVLLVERLGQPGHWQFPQGGREPGETPEQAILREMAEELGTAKFKIFGRSREGVYRYRWKRVWALADPNADAPRVYGYRGQRATVFYLQFVGEDNELRVDRTELAAYQWVPREEVMAVIHPVRRPLATIALQELSRYA